MKVVKGYRKKHNRIWLFPLFLFFFLCNGSLQAEAKADFSDYETVRHPLIQTTDVLEEYEALFHLGFLDTGEWESASFLQADNDEKGTKPEKAQAVSEYARFLVQLSRETAYEKARAAVVQIHMEGYYGSGVLWDIREGKLVIVSNAHLLKEGEKGQVTFRTGVSIEGTVIGISDSRDIGFMVISLADLEREDWFFLRFAGRDLKNYDMLQAGDELFVIGSANGAGEDYYEGTVGKVSYYFPEFQSDMLYGYCQALPGMSGGGTFGEEGNFIGMLTAGTEYGEIASLPVEIMVEEYEKITAGW